eukprot:1149969-Pelagomonas_calceolata.AAC.4
MSVAELSWDGNLQTRKSGGWLEDWQCQSNSFFWPLISATSFTCGGYAAGYRILGMHLYVFCPGSCTDGSKAGRRAPCPANGDDAHCPSKILWDPPQKNNSA